MNFFESIASLPKAEQDKIISGWQQCVVILSNLTGPQRQFVANFWLESRLCRNAWIELHGIILNVTLDEPQLQEELKTVFRRYLLQGGPIPPPVPAPLGRAVTKEVFIEILRDQFAFGSKAQAKQFLSDLLAAKTLASIQRRLHTRLIAKKGRIMWATFDIGPDGLPSGQNPFVNMSEHANGIRAQLGLISNKEERSKDLLLFVYNLPYGVIAHFPTLAEAYAGNDWLWYFQVANPLEPYGRTMPWPDTKYMPSPEVVHEPVTGNNLVEKIIIAKVRGRR